MKLYEPFQFLTTTECDELVDYSQKQSSELGKILEEGKVNNARITWVEDRHPRWQEWIDIFNKIEPVIESLLSPQIATYNPGEERQWHTDYWPAHRPTTRHFTLTCELQSAPGGKLEIENKKFVLKKGQAIIFRPDDPGAPGSGDRHRAVAPTEGQRISLTIWAMAKNLERWKRFQHIDGKKTDIKK